MTGRNITIVLMNHTTSVVSKYLSTADLLEPSSVCLDIFSWNQPFHNKKSILLVKISVFSTKNVKSIQRISAVSNISNISCLCRCCIVILKKIDVSMNQR